MGSKTEEEESLSKTEDGPLGNRETLVREEQPFPGSSTPTG